jgi:hypothetical protein
MNKNKKKNLHLHKVAVHHPLNHLHKVLLLLTHNPNLGRIRIKILAQKRKERNDFQSKLIFMFFVFFICTENT